jgi:hypothetical protein
VISFSVATTDGISSFGRRSAVEFRKPSIYIVWYMLLDVRTWTFSCAASLRGFGHARQHCLEMEPSSYKRCALGLRLLNSITSYSCQISAHSPKMVRLHDRRYTVNMLDVGFECVDSRHGLPGIDDMKLVLDTFGDMSAPFRDMSTSAAVTTRCEILTSACYQASSHISI